MSVHSVAEAESHLSDLIDRAIQGEPVVIARHGAPVVELKVVKPQLQAKGRAMTAADVEWLRQRRPTLLGDDNDPRHIVERMRDEDHERLLRR